MKLINLFEEDLSKALRIVDVIKAYIDQDLKERHTSEYYWDTKKTSEVIRKCKKLISATVHMDQINPRTYEYEWIEKSVSRLLDEIDSLVNLLVDSRNVHSLFYIPVLTLVRLGLIEDESLSFHDEDEFDNRPSSSDVVMDITPYKIEVRKNNVVLDLKMSDKVKSLIIEYLIRKHVDLTESYDKLIKPVIDTKKHIDAIKDKFNINYYE